MCKKKREMLKMKWNDMVTQDFEKWDGEQTRSWTGRRDGEK